MAKSKKLTGFASRLRTVQKRYELATGQDMEQKDIAKALRVSPGTVNGWFKGRRLPSVEQLEQLAKLLRGNAGWMAFGDQDTLIGPDGEPLESPSQSEQQNPPQGQRGRKG